MLLSIQSFLIINDYFSYVKDGFKRKIKLDGANKLCLVTYCENEAKRFAEVE